jgi:hypothetical protein
MRRLPALVLAVAALCAACTSGSDEPSPRPDAGTNGAVTLESLDLGWPKAQGKLVVPRLPAAPEGFDEATLNRMATVLEKWARLSTVDDGMWHSGDPLSDIRTVLPEDAAETYEQQIKGQVSPHLAFANVFRDDVTVVGSPMITSAWRVSADKDPANERFMRLELQTRAAYEVRLGDSGTRVIGVLRVHSLSAYNDTSDDFGVGGGWQEFGAGDCALALDDALVPDSDRAEALKDLKTFIRVGNGKKLEMPALPAQDQVDAEYLQRCRDGQV